MKIMQDTYPMVMTETPLTILVIMFKYNKNSDGNDFNNGNYEIMMEKYMRKSKAKIRQFASFPDSRL